MADEVHVHKTGGDGGAGWAVAIMLVVVLAVVAWFVFLRGADNTRDIDVDVNVPAQEIERGPNERP
jgi:hypothetical protein